MKDIPPPPSLKPLQLSTVAEMERVNAVVIASAAQHVPLITDITHHIVKSGGKRLRPVLTVACAKLLGYEGERHINLAASVELIHTATLLHDDVVDESTMRRGLDTANAIWSNQASVLVGDFLLSRAFQLMVADGSLEVLKLLSDASATISQGEVKQLVAAGDMQTTRETYLDIIGSKTAALFSAACEIAPIIQTLPDQRIRLKEFGTSLGIAFQLVDDALDYAASEATLGKAIGDDLREGKMTLPVIEAYAQGNADERAFWERVLGAGEYHAEDVQQAITIITRCGTIDSTIMLAKNYASHAAAMLDEVDGDATITAALHECLAFCIARTV
jgi:octaprenyl-diphosphate synthase